MMAAPMTWWQRLFGLKRQAEFPVAPAQLPIGGDWTLVRRESLAAYWRDTTGDVVSLTLHPVDPTLPAVSDTTALRTYCRGIAESQSAGLVDVSPITGAEGPGVAYIYKRLKIPAFTFFGVAATPVAGGTWIWLVIAYERGTTGVREAVVTGKLFEAGHLTMSSYEASWARDPYDPSYQGVDRRMLCYLSDAADYDADFPDHPLTKVRRELARLVHVRLSPSTAA